MDQAGRYTAEHNVMDANIKISSLEGRIKELLKENKQLIEETKDLRKQLDGCNRCKPSDSKGTDTVVLENGTKLNVGFVSEKA